MTKSSGTTPGLCSGNAVLVKTIRKGSTTRRSTVFEIKSRLVGVNARTAKGQVNRGCTCTAMCQLYGGITCNSWAKFYVNCWGCSDFGFGEAYRISKSKVVFRDAKGCIYRNIYMVGKVSARYCVSFCCRSGVNGLVTKCQTGWVNTDTGCRSRNRFGNATILRIGYLGHEISAVVVAVVTISVKFFCTSCSQASCS
ncbi:hypothetical protein D3C85_1032190 [compost metagenome]